MNTQNPLLNYSPEELKKALAIVESDKHKKENDRAAYKKLMEETVPDVVSILAEVSQRLSSCKTVIFSSFVDLLKLKNEVYGVKEEQQSHTFTTDTHSITIGFRINENWDDTVTAGISKVQTFIKSLAKDEETAVLVNSIMKLLQKNKKGDLQANKVLELKAMAEDFKNEEFSDGVDIILKSFKPTRGNWYIEAYTVKDGNKTIIPLGIAAVDFEPGYTFDFTDTAPDDKERRESNSQA